MKWLVLAIVALLPSQACAAIDETDYFCIFSNAASAQADVNVAPFWNASVSKWNTSTVFPGVSVITPQALINGISSLTGFWIIIAQTTDNLGLDADTACVMKLDRGVAVQGGSFVLAASITGTNRSSLTFQPVPFGSAYPSPLGQ